MRSLYRTFFNRAFAPLYIAQFLGAFNDNFLRNAMAIFVMYQAAGLTEQGKGMVVASAVGVFILPYFLFSATAGELADKYRKDVIIKVVKFCEMCIVVLAGLGFLLGSVTLILLSLFMMGLHSTFFGPVKYSIIPEMLGEKDIISGNALIESGTYIAILLGTVAGGLIIGAAGSEINIFGYTAEVSRYWFPCVIAVLAACGFISSLYLREYPAVNPKLRITKNIFLGAWKNIKFVSKSRVAVLTIIGISWFWFLGTAVISQIPGFAKEILCGDETVSTLFLALFSFGVGIGAVLCQLLLKGNISTKLVPVSAVLMSFFLCDAVFAAHGFSVAGGLLDYRQFLSLAVGKRVSFDLLMFSVFGGLYVVPLDAVLQTVSGGRIRSRMIAANNIINSVFMVLSSLLCTVMIRLEHSASAILGLVALLNTAAAVYICTLLPREIMRLIVRRILNIIYGVKVHGLENFRSVKGRTLIIANHTSFLDAVLLWCYIPEELYFSVDKNTAGRWWVKLVLHLANHIEVDSANPMAVKTLIKEVKRNRKVVIFPEGRITTTGQLMKIFPGPGMIADKTGASVVPVWIDGSQYSVFSRFGNRFKTSPHSRIELTVMPAVKLRLPPDVYGRCRRNLATKKIYELMVDTHFANCNVRDTLFEAMTDAMSLVGRGKEILEDGSRKKISYGTLYTALFALGARFVKRTPRGAMAGFFLPNAAGSVCAFYGMQAYGIVPCMLNFSIGTKNMLSCCRTAGIKQVYSSREFIEKGNLGSTVKAMEDQGLEIIYLEDIKKEIKFRDKISAALASFFPLRVYRKTRGKETCGDTAVVLFTSGSEGMPKGVALSHSNVLANCYQLFSVFDANIMDRFFNALPVFHSFGMIGMVLPLSCGMKLFMYPSPLHYRIIPQMIYDSNTTITIGTDTFFAGYARTAHPYDFYSTRIAIVAGEPMKEETSRLYFEKFGLRLLEAYGATELSPACTINSFMNFRSGTVGRLLPGMEYRLEKIEGVEDGGELFVRGSNVMKGYIRPELPGVVQPLENGWYGTGDIVSVDEDGFFKVRGRVKRFAKVGGEMVSLTAVENEISSLWPNDRHAVLNVPDSRKGEKLVLVTTNKDADRSAIAAYFRSRGISELSIPRTVIAVKEIPLMGSGKTDYVKLLQDYKDEKLYTVKKGN